MTQSTRTIRLKNPAGLHMRPAAEIVRISYTHYAEIFVSKGTSHANTKSIFELMLLGIRQGDTFELTAKGPDAEQALEALERFFENQDTQAPGNRETASGMDFYAA